MNHQTGYKELRAERDNYLPAPASTELFFLSMEDYSISSHRLKWFERDANRRAKLFFNRYYKLSEYYNGWDELYYPTFINYRKLSE